MSPALALRGTAKLGWGDFRSGDLQFITSASGSAAASISINNCFSAAFDHYLIMRNLLGSAPNNNLNVRLRVAGVDAAAADYRYQYLAASATSVTGARASGQVNAIAALGYVEATSYGFSRTWISNPFATVRTTIWPDVGYDHDGNIEMYTWLTEHDLATSYDGFSVIPTGGTITGDVYVYGLAV